jgi:hypothetical protein
VFPPIRGAHLVCLLDGTDAAPEKLLVVELADADASKPAKMAPNLAYAACLSRDQIVLAYLQQSLSRDVLSHVHRIEHSAELWCAIEQMDAAQSEARVCNLLIAITNTKQHQFNTTSAYLTKMQGFADELVAVGRVLLDKELISYILAGLGSGYDALVAALGMVTTPLSLGMLYSQIQRYDQCQEMHNGGSTSDFESSTNAAYCQCRPCSSNNA